jgi:hypothetical protein
VPYLDQKTIDMEYHMVSDELNPGTSIEPGPTQ